MSEEYLTEAQVAKRLGLSVTTLRRKKRVGVFKLGVHYFWPGWTRERWKWSAVKAEIEVQQPEPQHTKGWKGML